eukprot:TRINITY_DN8800_c1_g1_i1.p2 TRINITY_DN8800_c1_g1~~TRINITY_DN8800_c1_g1_i1.p2  ORF type:complete len:128 (+),score=4.00 TRINITY_DN8800_c1_g1_i1:40-423(+)
MDQSIHSTVKQYKKNMFKQNGISVGGVETQNKDLSIEGVQKKNRRETDQKLFSHIQVQPNQLLHRILTCFSSIENFAAANARIKCIAHSNAHAHCVTIFLNKFCFLIYFGIKGSGNLLILNLFIIFS